MDNELMTLLRFLSKKTYVTLKDIELYFNITTRQASYRLDKLNDLLQSAQVPQLSYSTSARKPMKLSKETGAAIEALLTSANVNEGYYFSKKERLIYIYLLLFLDLEYVSLPDFIDAMQVSRSTVLMDLKELTQILEEHHIKIKNNRVKGYYLVGSEMEIRRYMMRDVIYTLAEGSGKVFDVFIDKQQLDIFDYSRLVISELAQTYHIRFVEDRLAEFIYIFIFLKARMQRGKDASAENEQIMDLQIMTSMKEYEFTRALLKNYKNADGIKESDVNYIAAWILGISFGDINEDTKDCIVISDLIGKIMTRFEYLSGTHYKNTEEIFIQLYSHFRPAYYRLIFKLPIFNPLREKVKEEYPELYRLVAETMKPFQVMFGEALQDDEIAYLAMHFSMIYSWKQDHKRAPQKEARVVCSHGIGSSAILYNELKAMFPEFHFLPPTESLQVHAYIGQVDIIFSTNYIAADVSGHIPVIKVSPIMSTAERYQVFREVYVQMGGSFLKQPSVDVVMNIVSKYADIKEEEGLYHELIAYFSHVDTLPQTQSALTLSDMVNAKIIQLQAAARNWEEAVRIGFAPMVKEGYITQNYVEETIRSVKTIGPYIVITQHVALPHARPEAGALKEALGITVLKEPVVFGNEANDPVKYIFSLSAVNNENHIRAMAKLMELLNDQAFFRLLDEAKNAEEILQYINQ